MSRRKNGKQRKVVYVVYELMHGNVVQILDLPSKNQAEIKTESLISVSLSARVASWVLVDKNKGEVIAKFSGAPDQLPPWR